MSRMLIFCLLLGICSSLEAADTAKPSPAGVRYLVKVKCVQDKPETNHVDKEWWGTKGIPSHATIRGAQGLVAEIEVEDLKKTEAADPGQYMIKMVITAPGKDGKPEIVSQPQSHTIVDEPVSNQFGQLGPGWIKGNDIDIVIVEDGSPSRLSKSAAKVLSKKADEILASHVPFDDVSRPAQPICQEYHPTAESAAAAREMDESPAGRALRAEREAIAKRQAAAAAGKAFKDRGDFSAQIEFSRTVGGGSMSADTTVSGRKGEPLITMLGGSMGSTTSANGQKEPPSGEFIELDLREVAGAQPTAYQATFQVIAIDKTGKRSVACENKLVAKVGKPETLKVEKKDGERVEIRLKITEELKPEKSPQSSWSTATAAANKKQDSRR